MDFKKRIVQPTTEQKLEQEDYFIWGASVVGDDNGNYHMFASRWEKKKTFKAWVTASRIVRAVASMPEGPFEIVEEMDCLLEQDWSKKMVHNPTVKKIEDKYYLFYLGTTYPDNLSDIPERVNDHPARFNQCIGVAVADSPEGPWKPSKANPILEPREGEWDSTFVTNPAIFVEEDGSIRMIYKAKWHTDRRLILGMAVASNPEGPYQRKGPSPIFEYDVEDPYIWRENNKYWMIAKDMSGEIVERHNGILFYSEDGSNWQIAENRLAWDHTIYWQDESGDKNNKIEKPANMERPQLLIENNKPICFYTAIGDFETYSYNLARKLI